MAAGRRAAIALLLTLGGCTVGPDFKPPTLPGAPTWRGAVGDAAVFLSADPDPRWWGAFGDPVLTKLIETAIHDSLDVQQAVLRVVESRQDIVTARAAGLPSLNGTGSYAREQFGVKGILESEGVYRQLNNLADAAPGLTGSLIGRSSIISASDQVLNPIVEPDNLFQYGLSASWELDLFGQVRRSVEQARATAEAQGEAANDALTSLEREVAQAYVQPRGAQALIASQEQNIRSAEATLGLTDNRFSRGLSTALDVDQARTQLLNLERQLPEYDKQIRQAVNRLSVLIGREPGTLDGRLLQPAPLPALPAAVGLGGPRRASALARWRPDIREAEAQLHAATANVGIAVASFYPDVSLTGNLGIRALDASYLTRWASHSTRPGQASRCPSSRAAD